MFKCPECKTALPWRSEYIRTTTTVTCPGCHKALRTDHTRSGRMGGWGSVLGGLIFLQFGLLATVVYLALLFPLAFLLTQFRVAEANPDEKKGA